MEYLTNLYEAGIEMNPDQQRLFKILVKKNYGQHPLKDENIRKSVAEKELEKLMERHAKELSKEERRKMLE